MKIAYVKDAVYPWRKGGAQKRNWEVGRRLADDHDVHWYGMHYWDGPAEMEHEGITFHGVCEPLELHTKGRRSIRQALQFTRKLTRPLLTNDFDVIDCQKSSLFPMYPSKFHCTMNDSALVAMWTEVWADYWYEYLGMMGIFGKNIERVTVHLPDIIIAISDHINGELRSIGRERNIKTIHNGVDFEKIQAMPAGEQKWDAVYVGRLIDHKNVDMLLDAIATLDLDMSINCAIIGDGPRRDELEKYADTLGVGTQVEFLGLLDQKGVIRQVKNSKMLVLPSRQEGFSTVILEAGACGVATITVDFERNGSKAVIENGRNGFVTQPSSQALGSKIEHLLRDHKLREQVSKGAREFAQENDWDTITEKTLEVYKKATVGSESIKKGCKL